MRAYYFFYVKKKNDMQSSELWAINAVNSMAK